MPLTAKGEKIKSAMEAQYGSEKGKEVFYASKNKGTITGVDEMPIDSMLISDMAHKINNLTNRFDTFMMRRRQKPRSDDFTEAKHPRNANGVFVTGEGEEGREDNENLRTGGLSKRMDPFGK